MYADLSFPSSALAIGAHPDDIEFGCGGTLAKWAAVGCEVHMLVLTDGSKGTWNPSDDPSMLIDHRKVEALAAATVLGNCELHWAGLIDGELSATAAEREHIVRAIRDIRPEVLLGHDPWKRYRLHPDHRHAGWLTVDGAVAARDPHFFPEVGNSPHRPNHLLLFEADEPDHTESIDASLSTKIAALTCHRSQWQTTMGIDAGSENEALQHEAFAERVTADAQAAAVASVYNVGEAFRRLVL